MTLHSAKLCFYPPCAKRALQHWNDTPSGIVTQRPGLMRICSVGLRRKRLSAAVLPYEYRSY